MVEYYKNWATTSMPPSNELTKWLEDCYSKGKLDITSIKPGLNITIKLIFDCLKTYPSIREINFGQLCLSIDDMQVVCYLLSEHSYLQSLDLIIHGSIANQFAKALALNKSLKFLSISVISSNEKIADDDFKLLCNAIRVNNTITELNIFYDISGAAVTELNNAVALSSTITKFTFFSAVIDSIDTESLVTMLSDTKQLCEMHLSFVNTRLPGIAARIVPGLKNNSTLKVLNLGNNSLDIAGTPLIADALKENNCLETLILNHNWLGDKKAYYDGVGTAYAGNGPHDEGIREIAFALHENKSLVNLEMECNNIGPKGATYIAKALLINNSLQNINMRDAVLDDESLKAFADVIKVNKTLRKLYIGTRFDTAYSKGSTEIFAALNDNCTLQELDLSGIEFKNTLQENIKSSLANNRSLRSLDLSGCKMENSCMVAILSGLKLNSGLHVLKLGKIKFTNATADLLAKVIEHNHTLRMLDISSSDFSTYLENVIKSLELNNTLNVLRLYACKLNDADGQLIITVLEKNHSLLDLKLEANKFSGEIEGQFKALAKRKSQTHLRSWQQFCKINLPAPVIKNIHAYLRPGRPFVFSC